MSSRLCTEPTQRGGERGTWVPCGMIRPCRLHPRGDDEHLARALATLHAMHEPLDVADVQQRCARWTLAKFPDTTLALRCTKLLEEAGEVAKAVGGVLEGRPGRGDPVLEAAQTVLVLASLVGVYFPERDLFQEVLDELDRLEAGG